MNRSIGEALNRGIGEAVMGGILGAVAVPLLVFLVVLLARALGADPDFDAIGALPLSMVGAVLGAAFNVVRTRRTNST